MTLLYDSSALLNLIRSAGGDAIEYLRGNYILTLTPYEIGNALWKETKLLNRLSVHEALVLIQHIANVYKIMNITAPVDISLVFKLANEIKVTYYDSSYIVSSYELGADLVTDDNKLRRRIDEEVQTVKRILGKKIKIYSTKELSKISSSK